MATQSNVPMVSEVSICNQALSWVGQEEISSLDEKSKSAQWCRNNYPWLRDALLEARKWTFATVKAISTTENRDAWDQYFTHDKPLDWISVFRVYRDPYKTAQIEWRMEEGKVVALYDTVYLWGIARVTDTGKFSPLFVQALAARMAADMAIPMAQNRQLQADLWNLFEVKMTEAAAVNGQQGTNDELMSDAMVDARTSGAFRGYGGLR